MQEMIDSIGATIELAARQGIAKARIELQPEELGHIGIRLSQTSEGLRARVTADTPAGAQALSQGRSELRQSLSSLGLSLLQLDIGSSGQPQTGEQDERFAATADGATAVGATGTAEESEALAESLDDTRPAGTPRAKSSTCSHERPHHPNNRRLSYERTKGRKTVTSPVAQAAAAPSSGSASAASPENPNSVLGQNDFLKLMIAQLQAQNPLEPANGNEYVTELAQFTQLEQTTNLASASELFERRSADRPHRQLQRSLHRCSGYGQGRERPVHRPPRPILTVRGCSWCANIARVRPAK